MDGFGAAVGGYNIGISASADDKVKIYGIEVDKGVGLGLGITQLALYGIATTYGVIQAGRCNTLRHEQNMQTDAEAQARPPPPPPEDFKTPSAMIGDAPAATTHGAQDTAALPEWSAFRRVPLTRAPAASTTIPSRFEPR
jgi:hypothetical protein